MEKTKKYVTVFGSSMPKPGDPEYETALVLGSVIGRKGLGVCTGGYRGIMEAVSKGSVEEGSEAVGITVDIFNSKPNRYNTEVIEANSLLERLEILINKGDAYVILKGGTGTLVEFSVVWEYLNKGLMNRKPVACNGEMWKYIIDIIDKRMEFEGRETGRMRFFNQIEECAEYIIDSLSS